ncbi:MAG: TPM domain-containing protein [Clostridia bacterium]|nr:TPM domain-containing protein [Clostridia bacterium]
MKHRLTALLLAIMLILSVACGAFAVSYPQQRGNVNDDAAVLSGSTVADIGSLNTKVKNALGLNFVVVTRHFLGGAEAQSYCSGLFRDWNLDSNTILLLLVIGEEKYAVTTGSNVKKYISDEQINSLLSSKLRALYIEKRDYSGAVGNFLLALTAQAAATSGKKIETGGLFGTTAHSTGSSGADAFLGWTGNWAEGFFSNNSYDTTSYGANTSR